MSFQYTCGRYNKQLYNCRIKRYPDGRENITVFNEKIFNPEKWELAYGFEDEKKDSLHEYDRQYNENGVRLDNLKRAKEKVFDIAFANVNLWKYMVTFTLDRQKIDRYDADEVQKRFQRWLKNSVYRKNINYVLVAEPHKDGAIHFHGLLSDGLNYKFSGLYDESGREIYDILDYPFGFARAVPIDKDTESNCCKYITKYMTKDFTKIFGKTYWAGGRELVRECEVFYDNIDFNSFDVEPVKVPNSQREVKYILKGVTI